MSSEGQIRYELMLSQRGMPYDTERERQARLAQASRPWTPDGPGWRMVARLGDLLAASRSLPGYLRGIGAPAPSLREATRNASGASRMVPCAQRSTGNT
jgi:hypothetical protein